MAKLKKRKSPLRTCISEHERAFYSDLGKFLGEIRVEKFLLAEGVAEEAGISVSTLSHIELGKRRVSFYNLMKICKALDFPIDEVVRAMYRRL